MKFLLSTLFCAIVSQIFAADDTAVIYRDDFSGPHSANLHGQALDISPDRQTWISVQEVERWKADGSWRIPAEGIQALNANAFVPFQPQEGKVYRLTVEVILDGSGVFYAGFTEQDAPQLAFTSNRTGPCWRQFGPLGQHSGRIETATSGKFSGDFEASSQQAVTLVLDTRKSPWLATWALGSEILQEANCRNNTAIRFVGFGAHRPGDEHPASFQVSKFELVELSE